MIKNFPFKALMALLLLLISCSESDKFNDSLKPELELEIICEIYMYQNEPYIHAYPYLSQKGNAEYDYYWILDGERIYSQYLEKKVSYGAHFLKFVLIDRFGDTLSDSGFVYVDEPLKITLLSPVEEYNAAKTDTIVFQYKISGVDTWEEKPKTVVYVSTDSTDEENWKPLRNNFLRPPLNEQVYYWKVKAFNEQDTAYSEIRSVWIKD